MRKSKGYSRTKFPTEIIIKAVEIFDSVLKKQKKEIKLDLDVTFPHERWQHKTEVEFFSDYRKNIYLAQNESETKYY